MKPTFLPAAVKTPLLDALQAQIGLGRHRFHVPFHAGINLSGLGEDGYSSLFTYDWTELPSLDTLGNPHGVLLESQAEAALLFGARESFYLVNGASVGIIAAMLATGIGPGSHVLIARNCHRSVIHGVILARSTPHWILPDIIEDWDLWGEVNPDRLEQYLRKHPEIELFVITHPTYEGIPSDIQGIATVCRRHEVKLIVDEAHGSLFPLLENLPLSALKAGADAVIHSLHKSGGSMTQTALLHLPQGSLLHPESVLEALNLLQTTSPSYILMASLEATCAYLGSREGQAALTQQSRLTQELRGWINASLSTIHEMTPRSGRESFQLFLRSGKMTGECFAQVLEEGHGIAYEAFTSRGVLLMMNLGLQESSFDALKIALLEIDEVSRNLPDVASPALEFSLPQMRMTPAEAFFASGCMVCRSESVGRISRQVVAPCPPGIPMLIPGESIATHHLQQLPDSVMVVA